MGVVTVTIICVVLLITVLLFGLTYYCLTKSNPITEEDYENARALFFTASGITWLWVITLLLFKIVPIVFKVDKPYN